LELGTWNLELGTWNLEPGTWNLELETEYVWVYPGLACEAGGQNETQREAEGERWVTWKKINEPMEWATALYLDITIVTTN